MKEIMATQKYVSEIKIINWSNNIVYESLSNLSFLNTLMSPENMERVKQQLGDKADKFNIEDFYADRNTCSFKISPIGTIGFQIINREEPKAIKMGSSNESPIKFTIWIQILPIDANTCKIRLTLHTELDMMTKMMIGKKLKKGVDQIADTFSQIPFGSIQAMNNESEKNNTFSIDDIQSENIGNE
jgi:hypothetical protein